MIGRILGLAAVALVGAEGLALACSEVRGDEVPPCVTLNSHTPGEKFPVDLATYTIRLTADQVNNDVHRAAPELFPLSPELKVFRQTDTGFVAAPFTLEDGTVKLIGPQVGHHFIAWGGDTCRTQASPAGGGKDVDDFTLTPSAPLPTALGTATVSASVTAGREHKEGVGGDCQPVMIHLDEAKVVLTLSSPSADLAPWADAIGISYDFDGRITAGFPKADPTKLMAGQLAFEFTRICGSDTPRYLENPGLAEGTHTVRLRGQIEGKGEIVSNELTFALHCDTSAIPDDSLVPKPGGGTQKASEVKDDGCNASGGPSSEGPLALFALLAFSVARRVRSRSAGARGTGA